jgi:hypothetical protein
MSPEDPKKPSKKTEPVVVVNDAGEGVAERYVDHELVRARTSLKQTRVVCIVLFLFVAIYMGDITYNFAQAMEPHQAATIAKGLISQRINDNIPQVQEYIRKEVPTYISKVPDYIKTEMPRYREQLEARVESDFRNYASQTSNDLGNRLDTFLVNNKDSVATLLQANRDPKQMQKWTENLRDVFSGYLNATPTGGNETLRDKLEASLDSLHRVEAKTKRLAEANDLTPDEKKAKLAIATLLKTIGDKQLAEQVSEVQTVPTINGGNDAGHATYTPSTASNVKPHLPGAEDGPSTAPGKPAPAPAAGSKPAPSPAPAASNAKTGKLEWRSGNQAVFTAEGQPPVVLYKK